MPRMMSPGSISAAWAGPVTCSTTRLPCVPACSFSRGSSGRTVRPSAPACPAPGSPGPLLRLATVCCCSLSSATLTLKLCSRPLRHTARLASAPGRIAAIGARQLTVALDRMAVHAEDDVAGSDAGMRGRPVLLHRGHQRTARAVEPEGLGELGVDVLDGDADTAAHHVPGPDELLLDVARHVDRDGEGHAHEAAGAAEDLRVDADHFTGHVEQRAAGIAGIHRHVGLDEGHVVLARYRASGGADDARGGAVLEAERRADGEHPLPGLEVCRDRRACTIGRLLALILMTATSVRSSAPITLAGNSRRSVRRTVTSSALATTWVLVRM